jgi:hypothetical protein
MSKNCASAIAHKVALNHAMSHVLNLVNKTGEHAKEMCRQASVKAKVAKKASLFSKQKAKVAAKAMELAVRATKTVVQRVQQNKDGQGNAALQARKKADIARAVAEAASGKVVRSRRLSEDAAAVCKEATQKAQIASSEQKSRSAKGSCTANMARFYVKKTSTAIKAAEAAVTLAEKTILATSAEAAAAAARETSRAALKQADLAAGTRLVVEASSLAKAAAIVSKEATKAQSVAHATCTALETMDKKYKNAKKCAHVDVLKKATEAADQEVKRMRELLNAALDKKEAGAKAAKLANQQADAEMKAAAGTASGSPKARQAKRAKNDARKSTLKAQWESAEAKSLQRVVMMSLKANRTAYKELNHAKKQASQTQTYTSQCRASTKKSAGFSLDAALVSAEAAFESATREARKRDCEICNKQQADEELIALRSNTTLNKAKKALKVMKDNKPDTVKLETQLSSLTISYADASYNAKKERAVAIAATKKALDQAKTNGAKQKETMVAQKLALEHQEAARRWSAMAGNIREKLKGVTRMLNQTGEAYRHTIKKAEAKVEHAKLETTSKTKRYLKLKKKCDILNKQQASDADAEFAQKASVKASVAAKAAKAAFEEGKALKMATAELKNKVRETRFKAKAAKSASEMKTKEAKTKIKLAAHAQMSATVDDAKNAAWLANMTQAVLLEMDPLGSAAAIERSVAQADPLYPAQAMRKTEYDYNVCVAELSVDQGAMKDKSEKARKHGYKLMKDIDERAKMMVEVIAKQRRQDAKGTGFRL